MQEPKSKIIVNSKMARDPRIRDKLPKEITDMLEKETAKTSTVKARSKTPESKIVKPSTPQSPRKPESPTSTIPEDKRTPPPPPTIRNEIMKSTKSLPVSKKSSGERSLHHSGEKSRKRERDDHRQRDKDKPGSRKREESDKSPTRKREKNDENVKASSSSSEPTTKRDQRKTSHDSSPSPPPVIAKVSPKFGSRKPLDSKKFKIPKKNKSPSPDSFKEEGPHIEFNGGQPLVKKRKAVHGRKVEKKTKLTDE